MITALQLQRTFLISLVGLASLQTSSFATSFAPSATTKFGSGVRRVTSSSSNNNIRSLGGAPLFISRGGAGGIDDEESQMPPRGSDSVPSNPMDAASYQAAPSSSAPSNGNDDAMKAGLTQSSPSTESAPAQLTSWGKLGPNAPPPGLLRRTFPSFPWHRLPDWLTYTRCIAIPLLMGLFYVPHSNIATGWLFALASFTDWLDGYLARRWDISSAFGAFLDPVSDKLMVSTALILLAGRYGLIVAIPTSIILAREIAVSALREWMAQRGKRDIVKVGMQGKVKTALTMVSLTVLLFVPQDGAGLLGKLLTPGLALMYLCALVTVTSGSVYFIAAAPLLFGDES
mmetsp:Transcript_11963/g.34598  ORF Transcript_11963/g.34598 Transcript_11963/m.34598 type:complete len:343 (+) Transcript_11963:156-1184(+)|eukprot:CAMPEP_0119564828 /NCGR_PEP_ID=MMETSP1352-20130426/28128_1 /TAXON_ID=265584 /ORGANISM="Stauroneis constricta, Strain CCMP1120" /LENGTH=342 /DNA_ID=CAMNT_0007613625 /DNA_START=55 /DNA_END=1083 /DNA_ORIENTATION=-